MRLFLRKRPEVPDPAVAATSFSNGFGTPVAGTGIGARAKAHVEQHVGAPDGEHTERGKLSEVS